MAKTYSDPIVKADNKYLKAIDNLDSTIDKISLSIKDRESKRTFNDTIRETYNQISVSWKNVDRLKEQRRELISQRETAYEKNIRLLPAETSLLKTEQEIVNAIDEQTEFVNINTNSLQSRVKFI